MKHTINKTKYDSYRIPYIDEFEPGFEYEYVILNITKLYPYSEGQRIEWKNSNVKGTILKLYSLNKIKYADIEVYTDSSMPKYLLPYTYQCINLDYLKPTSYEVEKTWRKGIWGTAWGYQKKEYLKSKLKVGEIITDSKLLQYNKQGKFDKYDSIITQKPNKLDSQNRPITTYLPIKVTLKSLGSQFYEIKNKVVIENEKLRTFYIKENRPYIHQYKLIYKDNKWQYMLGTNNSIKNPKYKKIQNKKEMQKSKEHVKDLENPNIYWISENSNPQKEFKKGEPYHVMVFVIRPIIHKINSEEKNFKKDKRDNIIPISSKIEFKTSKLDIHLTYDTPVKVHNKINETVQKKFGKKARIKKIKVIHNKNDKRKFQFEYVLLKSLKTGLIVKYSFKRYMKWLQLFPDKVKEKFKTIPLGETTKNIFKGIVKKVSRPKPSIKLFRKVPKKRRKNNRGNKIIKPITYFIFKTLPLHLLFAKEKRISNQIKKYNLVLTTLSDKSDTSTETTKKLNKLEIKLEEITKKINERLSQSKVDKEKYKVKVVQNQVTKNLLKEAFTTHAWELKNKYKLVNKLNEIKGVKPIGYFRKDPQLNKINAYIQNVSLNTMREKGQIINLREALKQRQLRMAV